MWRGAPVYDEHAVRRTAACPRHNCPLPATEAVAAAADDESPPCRSPKKKKQRNKRQGRRRRRKEKYSACHLTKIVRVFSRAAGAGRRTVDGLDGPRRGEAATGYSENSLLEWRGVGARVAEWGVGRGWRRRLLRASRGICNISNGYLSSKFNLRNGIGLLGRLNHNLSSNAFLSVRSASVSGHLLRLPLSSALSYGRVLHVAPPPIAAHRRNNNNTYKLR